MAGCAAAIVTILLVRQWLYASTYRLYLEDAPAQGQTVLSRQRFEIVGDRVEPQILSAPADRVAFPVDLPAPSQLRVRAVPSADATVEIAILDAGGRRLLARRTLTGPTDIVLDVPPLSGRLELANRGEVRWLDPRLWREASAVPKLVALSLLVAGLVAARAFRPGAIRPVGTRAPLFAALTAALTALVCFLVLEAGLRLAGTHLPAWIAEERRDLGERQRDPRWQDSPRYGSRLAPGVRTFCEWQHGDIVRMGFLPPGLVRHAPYRFPFETDPDGFRNPASSGGFEDIAALGDSFTDAMTLPAELSWPSRLAEKTGVRVRNYGTAGFGPQQELLALRDYALPRRPPLVIVAFFAGNDLQDAERFADNHGRGGAPTSSAGWRFKQVIARFDQLYVVSLRQGLATRWREHALEASRKAPTAVAFDGEDPTGRDDAAPLFDRGLFALPVRGRTLRFAFLPAYLNGLRYSTEELAASRRWQLTRGAYREMKALVAAGGGELAVMFVPSKAQVYLPLLEDAFAPEARSAALRAALHDPEAPAYESLMAHRLALNGLMRDFCSEEGIPFLDLTPGLEREVAAGTNLYFPDDSHWNAAGQEAAAAALARWLEVRGLSRGALTAAAARSRSQRPS